MNNTRQYNSATASSPTASLPRKSLPSMEGRSTRDDRYSTDSKFGNSISSARPTSDRRSAISYWSSSQSASRQLSKRDLLAIVTRLSIMLRSGVDLADAVRSISLRAGSPTIESAMRAVYSSLESGQSLSKALEAERERFGGVFIASAAAGEASGKMVEVLNRLSQILKDDMRLQSSIRSSVSYPIVLFVVTALVMCAMLFFVLPQFGGIYESANAVVPPWTAVMLDISQLARQYWWLVIVSCIGLAVAAFQAVRLPRGRSSLDYFVLHAPLLSTMFRPLMAGRIFRLQGALLSSGVAMVDVLRLTRQSTNNSCFASLCSRIEQKVINGEGVAVALRESPFIPVEASEMIATAEVSGQLGNVLQTLGEFYEGQGEQKLRDVIKIAEPAIIVGMGILIGGMVLSVMLPLLDLSSAQGF